MIPLLGTITLIFGLLQLCQCQTEVPVSGSSPVVPVSVTDLRLCNTDDQISNTYCKCKDGVVSCDFTDYPKLNSNNSVVNYMISGNSVPLDTSRLCLCNTPPNAQLTFHANQFLPRKENEIHRFDFYNLKGLITFNGGFSQNFTGDLYISQVANITEIKGFEFGRGHDMPIPNLEAKTCCSPIKVDQTLKKPLLFIENSTLTSIASKGLDNLHLWKSVIIKSCLIKNIESQGIYFSGPNVAILQTIFENLTRFGLYFEGVQDLIMARNYFTYQAHYDGWRSRSTSPKSRVVLVDNIFGNGEYLDVDARQIVMWHNLFNVWDNETFHLMEFSNFPNRSVSLKYNSAYHQDLVENSINFGNTTIAEIGENVMESCNCSSIPENSLIKLDQNRCYSGIIYPTGPGCSIRLNAVKEKCTKDPKKTNFSDMCGDSHVAIQDFPGKGDTKETQISSEFIYKIVQGFGSLFKANKFAKLKQSLVLPTPDQEDETTPSPPPVTTSNPTSTTSKKVDTTTSSTASTSSTTKSVPDSTQDNNASTPHPEVVVPRKKTSSTVPIVLTLICLTFVLGGMYLAYRYRFRLRRRHHSLLDGSREMFM